MDVVSATEEEGGISAPPVVRPPGQCPAALTPAEEKRLQDIVEFCDQHGVLINKKKRRTLLALTDASFGTYKLGVIVANCCKDMDLVRAFDAYTTFKQEGIKPNVITFANLMSLTAGFGEQGMSLAPPRTVEPPQDISSAIVVFEDMKAAGFASQESVYTAMVRCCSNNQRAEDALKIYREMQSLDLQPKLRTLSPLLSSFSLLGNATVCFQMFDDLVHRYALVPTEREYLSMLRLTVQLKDRRFYEVRGGFCPCWSSVLVLLDLDSCSCSCSCHLPLTFGAIIVAFHWSLHWSLPLPS